ncbi:MAG: DNA-directed RNA polymerase subunit alpha [Synergistaceae bacterium]|nr:DNA-directed RNA polymerase subunit alpha [Synergistaceae bacterium]MBQ3759044.1 DNA-directed RNA polymerase subunit alpha [Synergistaceae bacterium]MBQ6115446.1 DNA-directed RNA polymerase subunit alpha [Synergistaceae bacterium]MBQ6419414.1 DNA-directed RNA polymerase subunit alpha [Synergistaceae bacterium]MBQ6665696.1 DNA-directed RNA polymerase subunit alpha [Synergistaceae bacterium]
MENTRFKVYIDEKKEDYGRIFIEPLERGYGDTLGNALRRLLLSSIRGAAVTAVRIDGILHEFSTIKGVREDVLEILLNLKHIPVKSKTENADVNLEGFKIITLDSDDLPEDFFTREENPGVITAKDMPWDADFEFFGDGKLCTLEPKSHILMEIYVSQGVGYLSAERERPAAPALPVDAMLTDAIFSPVKRVNYTIKPARVGQSIDYERLVLEVWTNGALSPEDAVSEAARIAEDYFGIIANTVPTAPPVEVPPEPIETIQPELEEEESEEAPRLVEHFSHPIHELELSIRSENCLLRGGIKTIGDLLNSSRDDLLKIRNLGKISLKEIEDRLDMLGYELKLHSDKPESQPETSEDDDEIVEEPAVEAESETEEPETEVQE